MMMELLNRVWWNFLAFHTESAYTLLRPGAVTQYPLYPCKFDRSWYLTAVRVLLAMGILLTNVSPDSQAAIICVENKGPVADMLPFYHPAQLS